ALFGMPVVTITAFMLSQISLETTFAYLSIVYAIRMGGLALALMPVMTSARNQLPSKWYSHGSAMANPLQQISAAIGTAILVTVRSIAAPKATPSRDARPREAALQARLYGYTRACFARTILAFIALVLACLRNSPKKEKEIVRRIHGQAANPVDTTASASGDSGTVE